MFGNTLLRCSIDRRANRSLEHAQASTNRDPYDHGLGRHRLLDPCNARKHARAHVHGLPGPSSPRGTPNPADSGHSAGGTNMLPHMAVARNAPQPIYSDVPGEPRNPLPTRTLVPEEVGEVARSVSVAAQCRCRPTPARTPEPSESPQQIGHKSSYVSRISPYIGIRIPSLRWYQTPTVAVGIC